MSAASTSSSGFIADGPSGSESGEGLSQDSQQASAVETINLDSLAAANKQGFAARDIMKALAQGSTSCNLSCILKDIGWDDKGVALKYTPTIVTYVFSEGLIKEYHAHKEQGEDPADEAEEDGSTMPGRGDGQQQQ